ncbi:MAG: hypothetical protein R3F37_12630 [Candidatus Competibacteraceae bacterium]
MALEEAILNAIEFGYGGPQDKAGHRLVSDFPGVTLVLHSRGLPARKWKNYPSTIRNGQGTLGHHRAGDAGHSEMMDRVAYSVLENGLRELRLLKLLPRGAPVSEAVLEEQPSTSPQDQSQVARSNTVPDPT